MIDNEFNVGDVVQLKSNGLVMTIVRINGTEITGAWFNKNSELVHELFDSDMLKHYDEPQLHLQDFKDLDYSEAANPVYINYLLSEGRCQFQEDKL